jgi:hypothetical protein
LVTETAFERHQSAEGRLASWFAPIDLCLPFWEDYRRLILQLAAIPGQGPGLPDPFQLQQLLPDEAVNQSGQAITFLPSEALPGIEYEPHIFRTAQVSTRENNWHDLFNALVWARFPRLKSAMNAVHYEQISLRKDKRRSRLRDALTLLDECGAIIASANQEALSQLAAHDWHAVFDERAACWQREIRIFVCGHALLEKFLSPYKSLTAHAALVCVDRSFINESRESMLHALDSCLAGILLAGGRVNSPADLSALPLMGIPGWWTMSPQDEGFYADRQVFRQPAERFRPAPVFDLRSITAHQEMP